jgi:S1-C subfamily serine protease
MAENEKNDFEFIKEQVIEKKWNKLKKRLLRLFIKLFTAVMFGVVAAVTFALIEPPFYKFLHKDGGDKPQISLPTASNDVQNVEVSGIPDGDEQIEVTADNSETKEVLPETVIQKINADLSDYQDMYYEIRKVAYKVNKSIVNVTSTFIVEDWFNNVVEKTVSTTGVIVTETATNYYILVSLDRIRDADNIRLKFSDTTYVEAWLIDHEEEINLAIITVNKGDIPSIYLSGLDSAILDENYSLVVGNPVIALGSPNGHLNSLEVGIITSEGSGAGITDNVLELFNTDIADNPESDGVIVNIRGEIIGWITRTLKQDENKSINTAISVDYIRSYILRMVNQNSRVYFGIKTKDMTEDAKQTHNVSNGIYVSEVLSESPAFKGDIKNGDIILLVNGKEIMSTNSFYRTISRYEPGTELKVKIKRTSGNSEKLMDVSVVLSNKPQ